MSYKIILRLFFIFSVIDLYSQQVQLEGLDVRTVIIDDTITIGDYIHQMNRESINHHIKSTTEFMVRKNGKSVIKSRKLYNQEGNITYKVDYGWNNGKDSAMVYYHYDSLKRLIKAERYNSIFDTKDKGVFLLLEYDNDNKVIKCETKSKMVRFSYHPNGKKDWAELSNYYHLCYPSVRRPKIHVYDTIVKKYHFKYNENYLLNNVLNSTGDTIVNYKYEQQGKLIKKMSGFLFENYIENGQTVKSSIFEIRNPSLIDSVLFESCDFVYIDNKLSKCTCKTGLSYMENYSIDYKYNDKGLLIEQISKNDKGKTNSTTLYTYEYY